MNQTYTDTNDSLQTPKITSIMKTVATEMKAMMQRIPEILCFTFESYLLGYKYQELTEMVKIAVTSIKAQQDETDGLWNFKNWGKKK